MSDTERGISIAESIRRKWVRGDKSTVDFLLYMRGAKDVEEVIREETLEALFEDKS